MLCSGCEKLSLNLEQQDAVYKLCTYDNLYSLRSVASSCNLCHLIHEDVKDMEDPEVGAYCKQKWGPLFFEGLKQSPIHLYHIALRGEHNLVTRCEIDVTKFSGYTEGPRLWRSESPLGGIYVPPGTVLLFLKLVDCLPLI